MNDDMFQNEDEEELFTDSRERNPYGSQQTDTQGQNPYGSQQTDTQGQNPYGSQRSDTQGQNQYGSQQSDNREQNPYGNEPKYGASGKKLSIGLGIASMVLGIVSLLCFCSGLNIITGIIAIILGIVQIVTCEKKGMAIAGITTAAISIALCIGCYAYIFSNSHFMRMIENEMLNEFGSDDIQDFIQKYQDGDDFEYYIDSHPEDGDYQDGGSQGNGEEIL